MMAVWRKVTSFNFCCLLAYGLGMIPGSILRLLTFTLRPPHHFDLPPRRFHRQTRHLEVVLLLLLAPDTQAHTVRIRTNKRPPPHLQTKLILHINSPAPTPAPLSPPFGLELDSK